MNTKRPTLKTVAEHANVSLPTVSQVIRGVGRISEETRKRVLFAANEVNYIPDERAASIRSGKSLEVGMIVHDLANSFNAEVISGVSDYLEARGYVLSILDARDDEQRLERCVKMLLGKIRGGLIWVPTETTPPQLFEQIRSQSIPSVSFLRDGGDPSFSNISIANEDATTKSTAYLLGLGHSKIAYFGGDYPTQTRTSRYYGCSKAMAKAGLPAPMLFECENSRDGGFEAVMRLREHQPEITALVCNGDEVAIGACLGLLRRGETPGEEMSIIGFDDIPEARLMTPALTTSSVNSKKVGERLAEKLLKLNDGATDKPQELISAELIIRETTKAK